MARGKHTQSAATRRAIGERDQQIESYQHTVKRLTADNKHLRERLEELQRGHSREVRRLKAERDDGLSPTLSVVQRENRELRERADRAERDLRQRRERDERAFLRLVEHMHEAHGLVREEAVEEAARLLVPDWGDRIIASASIAKRPRSAEDVEGFVRIARARGERR
jgi:predicted RNase H-like nuclease (RuvC/YqgF family)